MDTLSFNENGGDLPLGCVIDQTRKELVCGDFTRDTYGDNVRLFPRLDRSDPVGESQGARPFHRRHRKEFLRGWLFRLGIMISDIAHLIPKGERLEGAGAVGPEGDRNAKLAELFKRWKTELQVGAGTGRMDDLRARPRDRLKIVLSQMIAADERRAAIKKADRFQILDRGLPVFRRQLVCPAHSGKEFFSDLSARLVEKLHLSKGLRDMDLDRDSKRPRLLRDDLQKMA